MKSYLNIISLSILFLLPITFCYSQDNSQELKNTIQKIGNESVQAYLKGDLELLYSYYTDDAIQMPLFNKMIKGKEAIKSNEIASRESGIKVDTLFHHTLEVWSCDSFVYEIGTYEVSMILPGAPSLITDEGKYLTIWQRQDDEIFKIKLEIWNTDINPFLQSK